MNGSVCGNPKPVIAITIGDPAGIGAEVTLKALADPTVFGRASWVVVGDRVVLERTGTVCGIDPGILHGVSVEDPRIIPGHSDFAFGRLSESCGRAAVEYVRRAATMCLDGKADAMVTAPLNKEAVTLSGMPFTGHTEFIAELCGAADSRMLLANDRLRVVHVSTHVSLATSCRLGIERIVRTIELGHEALRLLGFEKGRVAVCGLNPHAGEHGLFGKEDMNIIAPAVRIARERGIACEGPLPPDTTFLKALRGSYDLVVAMYHDQGHIPMKLIDFEGTVNVSLGIPIIRTSVDHGTAFDIAGKNLANPTNMMAAMKMAAVMAASRKVSGPWRRLS